MMTRNDVFEARPQVTRAQAIREYRRHGLTEADLVADLGDLETYDGAEVLAMLGY